MRYEEIDCAVFYKTKERLGELSNMCSGFPIRYSNQTFFSTEALYQCCRYPGRPDLHEKINVPNAMLAKMKSKPPRSETRNDWLEQRIPIMEACLRLKVEQHPYEMTAILQQTTGRYIVEKSRNDQFWGAKPIEPGILEGENVLGLLWMVIRQELLDGTFHSDVTLEL